MTRIILESKNKSDVLLITELADRLKIRYKIGTRIFDGFTRLLSGLENEDSSFVRLFF